jgi:vanillate O-demethylase monooxygenase subunit
MLLVRFQPAKRAWVVPRGRNFDKDAPLQDTLDFNHQVFGEDKDIVEEQYPEDLPIALQDEVHIAGDKRPIALQDEVHIAGDKSSMAYRKGLAALRLGRSFTA